MTRMMDISNIFGKCSTCSEGCFSLARLNLIRQSCVFHTETFVQLGKDFRGGATIPIYLLQQRHPPRSDKLLLSVNAYKCNLPDTR